MSDNSGAFSGEIPGLDRAMRQILPGETLICPNGHPVFAVHDNDGQMRFFGLLLILDGPMDDVLRCSKCKELLVLCP